MKNQKIYSQSLYGKSMRVFEKKTEKLINEIGLMLLYPMDIIDEITKKSLDTGRCMC